MISMSLIETFFAERQQTQDRYQDKDYYLLDDFLQQTGISVEQLTTMGFLEPKPMYSTADLYNYQLSDKGKKCLKELKKNQLVLVNKTGKTRLLKLSKLEKMT